jgi:hypothetical protein
LSDLAKIVDTYIPPSLWDYEPVVAGGFALWAYILLKKFNEDVRTETLKRLDKGERVENSIIKFSDIDIWFQEDSPWHDDCYSPLIAISGDDAAKKMRAEFAISSIEDVFGGYEAALTRTSKWGNTYSMSPLAEEDTFADKIRSVFGYSKIRPPADYDDPRTRFNYQLLKKKFGGIDELFDEFDFLNCCVAIVKEDREYRFVTREGVDEAIDSGILESNDKLPKRDFGLNIYSIARAYRYYYKYNWQFSDKLAQEIFEIYFELITHPLTEKRNEEPESSLPLFNLSNIEPMSDFSSDMFMLEFPEQIPDDLIIRHIKDSISWFELFTKMDSFKEEYCLFFINTGIREIDSAVERYYE